MNRTVEPEGAGEHAPATTLPHRSRGLRGGAHGFGLARRL